jgi:hypothetical protein
MAHDLNLYSSYTPPRTVAVHVLYLSTGILSFIIISFYTTSIS